MYNTNEEMYNADQKEAFISIQKSDDAKYTTRYLFKMLCKIEEDLGYDIANGDPHQYGYQMWKVIDFGSLEYFKKLYNLLLRYRTFCISNGLIDRVIFASNRQDIKRATSSPAITQMYLELSSDNLKHELEAYINPENVAQRLMHYFCNTSYFNYVDTKSFTIENMLTLYMMLIYYGVREDEMANIKIEEVSEDKLSITTANKTFDIDDCLTASMIEKRLSADAIFSKTHNQGYKAEILSDTHLMISDDGRDNIVQIKSYYTLYRKNKMIAESVGVDLPTLKEVRQYGNVYRTCCAIIRDDVDASDKKEVIRLYCKVANVSSITNAKSIEIYELIFNALTTMKNK